MIIMLFDNGQPDETMSSETTKLFFLISLILVFKNLLVPCETDGLYSMFIVSFTFKHFRTSESSFTRIHKPL